MTTRWKCTPVFLLLILVGCDASTGTPDVALGSTAEDHVYAPSVPIGWQARWQEICVRHNLGDADTTYSCNPRSFVLRIDCGGAPCAVEPATAQTTGVASADGAAGLVVRPLAEGTFTMTATMEDTRTGEVVRNAIAVRVMTPERLEMGCTYLPSLEPSRPCPVGAGTYDPKGMFEITVDGWNGAQQIDVGPGVATDAGAPVTLTGFTLFDPHGRMMRLVSDVSGPHAVRTTYGSLTASYEADLTKE